MRMKHILLVEIGMGIDQHGQDVTTAAVRAVEHAIRPNALPGLKALLPGGSTDNMRVDVTLAVPRDAGKLDIDRVKAAFPYGKVSVRVVDGGMVARSHSLLPDQGDITDEIYVVNAAVEVGW